MTAAHIAIPRRSFALLFVILLIVGLAVAAFTFLPKATITITPATFEKIAEQEITLSSSATEPDFVRFVLPAKVVEASVEEQETIARDGGEVSEDFAKGIVTLKNEQDEEQPLLPKTHLRHEATGVFFLTDKAVRLPVQGELEVSVTAKNPGASGNVPAGRWIVDKLPANLQATVYGVSNVATTGGEVFENPLSEAEVNDAKQRAEAKARERVLGELTAAAGGASITEGLTSIEAKDSAISAKAGSRATTFTVTSSLQGRAFVVDENDLLGLTALSLRATPSADEDFISYNPKSFSAEIIKADFERGEARVKATLTGNFSRKTEAAVFDASNLAGRSADEVQEYFKQFESAGDIAIDFSPFWVSKVPSRPAAIEIIIKSESN